MSTEAMREAFNKRHQFDIYPEDFMSGMLNEFSAGWQAATASQEALIKAALDAAKEKVMLPYQVLSKTHQRHARLCVEAIDQITPQQVMERMK